MYTGMQDDLWAPFNVRPVFLIAYFGQELIGAKSKKNFLNLFAAIAPPAPPALGPVLVTNHF